MCSIHQHKNDPTFVWYMAGHLYCLSIYIMLFGMRNNPMNPHSIHSKKYRCKILKKLKNWCSANDGDADDDALKTFDKDYLLNMAIYWDT